MLKAALGVIVNIEHYWSFSVVKFKKRPNLENLWNFEKQEKTKKKTNKQRNKQNQKDLFFF